jgi:tRNA threonylcarbamoyladenosine biosynthesis protein TsaB
MTTEPDRLRLLALDASTHWLSVAATDGSSTVALDEDLGGAGAGARMLDTIDACLEGVGLERGALQGIVVGIGPGAFTGVRLAVAVAQGLGYGLGLPLVGVCGLEAQAEEAHRAAGETLGATRVLVVNDARMGEVYWAAYERAEGRGAACPAWVARAEPGLQRPGHIEPPFDAGDTDWVVCGNALAAADCAEALRLRIGARPTHISTHARARLLLALAAGRLRAGGGVQPALLAPLYVRDKVALTVAERAAAAPAAASAGAAA